MKLISVVILWPMAAAICFAWLFIQYHQVDAKSFGKNPEIISIDAGGVQRPAVGKDIISNGFAVRTNRMGSCVYIHSLGEIEDRHAKEDTIKDSRYRQDGESINLRCFGAIGDGKSHPLGSRYKTLAAAQADYPTVVTLSEEIDDAAFKRSLTAATSGMGGMGKVYLPAGAYRIDTTLIPSNLTFDCDGSNTSIIIPATTTSTPFNASFSVGGGNILISRCGFQGADGTTQSAGAFVHFNNCTMCRVSDFQMARGYDSILIDGANSVATYIDHGQILNSAGADITVNGGSDLFIDKVVGSGTSPCGLKVIQSAGLWTTDSDFVRHLHGTCILPSAGQLVQSLFFTSSAIGDSSIADGMLIQPTNGGRVDGIKAINSWTSSNGGSGVMTLCDAKSSINHIDLEGHAAYNNQNYGLSFKCGASISVNGGMIANNSIEFPGKFSGVYVHDINGYSQIGVHFASTQLVGADRFPPSNQANAVIIDGASNNYLITSNVFSGGHRYRSLVDNANGSSRLTGGNID